MNSGPYPSTGKCSFSTDHVAEYSLCTRKTPEQTPGVFCFTRGMVLLIVYQTCFLCHFFIGCWGETPVKKAPLRLHEGFKRQFGNRFIIITALLLTGCRLKLLDYEYRIHYFLWVMQAACINNNKPGKQGVNDEKTAFNSNRTCNVFFYDRVLS